MRTLVLGHGRAYRKHNIRCSPIDVDEWYDKPYECVDDLECVYPDILFKLGAYHWTFAEDASYDSIIDCTGGILSRGSSLVKTVEPRILQEIQRILAPYGVFYTEERVPWVYIKSSFGSMIRKDKAKFYEWMHMKQGSTRSEGYPIQSNKKNIANHVLVKDGTYTVEDYLESAAIKSNYEKQMSKFDRYRCNICNTKHVPKEQHDLHLASEEHKIARSRKMVKWSCPIDPELLALYRMYHTRNSLEVLKNEENDKIRI